jgi:integrase
MASIKPYGKGEYRAQVARKGVRDSQVFTSKGAAVAWAGQREAEIMAGDRGEVPNLTVADLLKRYEREVSKKKKGRRWEEIRLRAIGRDRLGLVKLRQLDAPHVSDWQQRRLEVVSEPSVRRERNLLNNVFEIALKEWRWLKKNPFYGIRRPKDGRSRKRTASDVEVKILLGMASESLRRTIVFALETGMRAGEIALPPVISGSVATLYDSKNGESRDVPLSEKAIEVWGDGIHLTAGSISTMFAKLCEEAKIEGLTFHDLRHTAATRLAKKLDLFELCRMFGWKDPRHALIYYNETAAQIAKKL